MPPPGNQGAAALKDLRVLLPFTTDNPRIPDELAAELGSGSGDALVIGTFGGDFKTWHVEVRRDGGGALLGRGWPEFAAACGAGTGWFVVLRHRGRGVLTVKAFDASGCLRELGAPAPTEAEAIRSRKEAPAKLQFISTLAHDFMEKMLIPAKFVQLCIPEGNLNNMAVIFGPTGKICKIQLEINRSGMFFAGGWSQFLSCRHGITGANALLLRYEANMVFTVKIFEPNGCLRGPKHGDFRMQQISTLPGIGRLEETPSQSITRHESKNDQPTNKGQKIPQGSMTCLKNGSKFYCVYNIGPPAWMKKKMQTSMTRNISLPRRFCDAIGFQESCMITLQDSMDSTRLWHVQGHRYSNGNCYIGLGWRNFCHDNRIKERDVLTFNVVRTMLWRVDITRCKENRNHVRNHIRWSRRTEGKWFHDLLEQCQDYMFFEIGPPTWIKKDINTGRIEDHLYLPAAFCDAIGLQETCLVTLKSSLCGARSWQVCVSRRKDGSSHRRSCWKRFCQENEMKQGDVCTFNIVETRLWHVLIERC